MEYMTRKRHIKIEDNELHKIYQHDLQMYDFPPEGDMQLEEFKQLGIDRLRVLQHVESNATRTDLKTPEERKQNLSAALRKDGLLHFAHLLFAKGCDQPSVTDLEYRRKDHISHFILRLAYCRDPDRQVWFINQEVDLFKLRFSSLNKEGVEKLLSMHNIDCKQVMQEEKSEIREELHMSTARITNIDIVEFYKVPFQKVIDLVRTRKVYINQGMVYLPHTELASLFTSYFRQELVDGMAHAKWCITNISDDERLIAYFNSIHRTFSDAQQVVWTTATTPIDKLDELSKVSYPLCMRTLHEALKTHHHLKNSGRLQYGLFIKGIGVTLEDALCFWRTEFTKKMDADKFNKQYAYTIRHIYGKEGKQTNYTPLGCPKIISSAVGPGEYHGCPFKHMDSTSLKQKLFNYNLPMTGIDEILELTKERNYHIACASYFKLLHNRLPDKPILHPNGYYMESRAILGKDNAAETESKEKFSQSGRFNDKMSTPKTSDTKSSFSTPSRITPTSRLGDKVGTPSRRSMFERGGSMTPVSANRATPKRIEIDLNEDEIAELISEDM